MMIERQDKISDWLKSEGYQPSHYSQPYSFFVNDNRLIGICITCGLAITGIAGQPLKHENKRRWHTRSIEELKKIIDEGIATK